MIALALAWGLFGIAAAVFFGLSAIARALQADKKTTVVWNPKVDVNYVAPGAIQDTPGAAMEKGA